MPTTHLAADADALSDHLQQLCQRLEAKAVVVLTKAENGVITLLHHGFTSHAAINGVLSVGIHANLTSHDQHVLAGAAGPVAQAVAQSIQPASE